MHAASSKAGAARRARWIIPSACRAPRAALALCAALAGAAQAEPRVLHIALNREPAPAAQHGARGRVAAVSGRPAHFPHRIWAACDFEGQTPDYGWFGLPERSRIPAYPGNGTALVARPEKYENVAARMAGINPVPGPRMGQVNQLCLRYYLKGTTEATFQYFSLTREDNCHIHVTGLTEGRWDDLTLNFTRDGRRNDGSEEPFAEGERMDDFKVMAGRPDQADGVELLIDDVIFFADRRAGRAAGPRQTAAAAERPFPQRVIFLAAFDTGPADKYWPGHFELLERDLPEDSYWRVARAVPRDGASGKWIRLQIEPARPVGAQTRLRFRCHLRGATALTVQIFDATVQDNRHLRVTGVPQAAWRTFDLDFQNESRRNDGSPGSLAAGNKVDDLFFFVEPAGAGPVELLVDEVVLYDAGVTR